MKQTYTASTWKEGRWFIAQCLEVDVASQGRTEADALANLKEALELYFEPPVATRQPKLQKITINAAESTLVPRSQTSSRSGRFSRDLPERQPY